MKYWVRIRKGFFPVLKYIEHLINLAFTNTRFVFISDFASLVGIPVGIASSTVRLKISAMIAGIKKERKKYDKIELLAKTKSNAIELLTSRAFID